MTLIKRILCFLITGSLLIVISTGCGKKTVAQKSNATLKQGKTASENYIEKHGLHLMTEDELGRVEMNLDPSQLAIFDPAGKRIYEDKYPKYFMSSDYSLDLYGTDEQKIKAGILRKATEEEKAMMEKMLGEMNVGVKEEMIGEAAPGFDVTDIKGNTYKLADLKGKVVVMNYWFVGCKPCIDEMPHLNKLVKKYKDEEVVFIAITFDKKETVEKFLSKKEFDYNIVVDRDDIVKAYDAEFFPTHYIIDQEGKIAFASAGLNEMTVPDLEKRIGKLLK